MPLSKEQLGEAFELIMGSAESRKALQSHLASYDTSDADAKQAFEKRVADSMKAGVSESVARAAAAIVLPDEGGKHFLKMPEVNETTEASETRIDQLKQLGSSDNQGKSFLVMQK